MNKGFFISIIIMFVLFPSLSFATHYNVFLFAGQSNCAGADAVCDNTCTTSRCTTTGTQDLNGLGTQQEADLNSIISYTVGIGGADNCATTPINTYPWGDIRGHNGYTFGELTNTNGQQVKNCGSDIAFARTLYAAGWRNIAIIKFSENYTSLEGGHSRWYTNNACQVKWFTDINARLSELITSGHSYTVRGVLWHQGIDDGILHRSEADYETDLTQIITDIRTTYGASLPFILARSVNSAIVGDPWMGYIRTGQVDVATAAAYSDYVSVDDLTPYVNTHHVSAAKHLILGDRMADAMLGYLPPYPDYGTR